MARQCRMTNCSKYAVRKGVCVSHGARVDHARCIVHGCTKFAVRGGVCVSHGAKKPYCRVEGCNRQAQQKGVCVSHGAKKAQCHVPTCLRQAVRGGLCKAHAPFYSMSTCSFENCSKIARKDGFCWWHGNKDTDDASPGPDSLIYHGGDLSEISLSPSRCRSGRNHIRAAGACSGQHDDTIPQSNNSLGQGRIGMFSTMQAIDRDESVPDVLQYTRCAVENCNRYAKFQSYCLHHSSLFRRSHPANQDKYESFSAAAPLATSPMTISATGSTINDPIMLAQDFPSAAQTQDGRQHPSLPAEVIYKQYFHSGKDYHFPTAATNQTMNTLNPSHQHKFY